MSKSVDSTEVAAFWSLMSSLYRRRDDILESSNRIIELSYKMDTIKNQEASQKAQGGTFDDTELKEVLSEVHTEMNSILSYSHELYPHLKNPSLVNYLSMLATSFSVKMGSSTVPWRVLLDNIIFNVRLFAQNSNELILNPTRKSMEYAFGIRIGVEWAAIQAYVAEHRSNY